MINVDYKSDFEVFELKTKVCNIPNSEED